MDYLHRFYMSVGLKLPVRRRESCFKEEILSLTSRLENMSVVQMNCAHMFYVDKYLGDSSNRASNVEFILDPYGGLLTSPSAMEEDGHTV
ncbi:hypothetical protein AMTR_s00081p00161950 [Amborella trichopoda]|uniref:Uncharacterized protein n=1 Tax=Amborella trichopoda TaxID=13333 RepID=W1P3T5_AMBTC|nr:hypothetical protein AMTR_s00081p00161950 [Amborella trichopoda]